MISKRILIVGEDLRQDFTIRHLYALYECVTARNLEHARELLVKASSGSNVDPFTLVIVPATVEIKNDGLDFADNHVISKKRKESVNGNDLEASEVIVTPFIIYLKGVIQTQVAARIVSNPFLHAAVYGEAAKLNLSVKRISALVASLRSIQNSENAFLNTQFVKSRNYAAAKELGDFHATRVLVDNQPSTKRVFEIREKLSGGRLTFDVGYESYSGVWTSLVKAMTREIAENMLKQYTEDQQAS